MIAPYSPQPRGRSERGFSTWQGRLPQELRLREIKTLEATNAFLSDDYVTGFNRKFKVPAPQHGSAFLPCPRGNLDLIFCRMQRMHDAGSRKFIEEANTSRENHYHCEVWIAGRHGSSFRRDRKLHQIR